MRLWIRTKLKLNTPSGFQGRSGTHQTSQMVRCFTNRLTLSPDNPIPGKSVVKKKRELFLGRPHANPSLLALPLNPVSGCGILTTLPFGDGNKVARRPVLRNPLGPANPCTNPVHMETFSTSVFKILI